jgi:hypothetical protein
MRMIRTLWPRTLCGKGWESICVHLVVRPVERLGAPRRGRQPAHLQAARPRELLNTLALDDLPSGFSFPRRIKFRLASLVHHRLAFVKLEYHLAILSVWKEVLVEEDCRL